MVDDEGNFDITIQSLVELAGMQFSVLTVGEDSEPIEGIRRRTRLITHPCCS